MTTQSPASRAIINEEKEESRIPLLGWRQSDTLFVVLVGLACFFAIGARVSGGLIAFAGAGLGACIGGLIIYAKPEGYNIIEASTIGFEYLLQPNVMFAASEDADTEAKNKGGLMNKSPLKALRPTERTQDLTNIKLAYPGKDAILSKDGRMERIIQIEGENMDFADPGIWADRQEVGQKFADRHIDDRAKLYVTTRDFDFDAIVERLEQRLEDKDIKQAPVAEAVLEQYRKDRPEKLRERGTQQVKTYLVISIAKDDVSTGYADEQTPEEKLAGIPGLSYIVKRITDVDDGEDSEESRTTNEVMIDKLNQLTKKVQDGLIDQTEGYSGRQLTTVEMVVLAANIYNDRDVNPDMVTATIGEQENDMGEHELGDQSVVSDERREKA